MFVVTVTFTIREAHVVGLLSALRENAARSLSEEAGCHRFDICRDPERPGEVFLYELNTDAAAFDAHKATAHYADFSEATLGWVQDKTVRTWHLDG
ncbi:antibiotic biosynthesis monooxygenase [Roseibacterium beibuensis]|uniref:ABM domain-containing protein n=1 Tax=[Roseibacterium] beibuensis TaxID=1193142 RepID=A0ABP9L708_9RHOB|nr:putative quinol monooxygenase [Roseibacterium beibuensis]MCS6623682.1 antibiotic biosynthesis monooxygenase [Roseibacterium beibuensis]